MRRIHQVVALCAIFVTMSLSANPVHDKDSKNKHKGKKYKVEVGHRYEHNDDVIYYYETKEEYEARRKYNRSRRTWTSECNERVANVERHIRQIVRAEARASNMSGPVSVTSFTTTCGPGASVTIAARTLVGTQWYQFRCELLPTDRNPNSPVGWIGKNHVWERIGPIVVIQPAPTPAPIPAPRRPSR